MFKRWEVLSVYNKVVPVNIPSFLGFKKELMIFYLLKNLMAKIPWKAIGLTVVGVSFLVFGVKATFPITFNKVSELSGISKLNSTSKVLLNSPPIRHFFISDKCLTKIRHRVGILDKNSLNDDSLMNFFLVHYPKSAVIESSETSGKIVKVSLDYIQRNYFDEAGTYYGAYY